jgi:pimeloyl-ACP methyl ester carboxylesterase
MLKTLFWTQSRARLQLICSSEEGNLNWLFLPGGPGLGSESLLPLLKILQLPGKLWLLDLAGDGSNTTSNNSESFKSWPVALVEAAQSFDHVVFVAHSTGGMYVLSLPKLEKHLEGLVLLDSAPDTTWQSLFAETIKKQPISGLQAFREKYEKDPSNEALKALTLASAPYLFTKKGQASGIESLCSLPYNYETCVWSEKHFDRTYQAKWVPKTIPTLILAGEMDLVTPLKLFQNDKRFSRENIIIKSIKAAGHFPWIENPAEVTEAFNIYANQLRE